MRFVIRALTGLVLAIVILVVAAFFLVPSDRIARVVETQFQNATGRAMHIGGEIRPTFFPSIGVKADDIRIENADWATENPMVTAESLAVNVSTLDLFRGKITVQGVDLKTPVIRLMINASGQQNWDFSKAAKTAAPSDVVTTEGGATLPRFTLDKAEISNGHLIYDDKPGKQIYDISAMNATLRLPDFDGEAGVDVSGTMNKQNFSIKGTLAEFSTFLSGRLTPVSLAAAVGKSTVDVSGNLGLTPLAADMNIDVDLADQAAVFGLIGMAAPDLPKGLGRNIAMKGNLKYTPDGAVYLRESKITLDQNTLSADVDLFLTGKPKLRVLISADSLDLSGAMASDGGGSASSASAESSGWSTAPIDVSFISGFDGDIDLRAKSVNLGDVVIGPVDTMSRLSDSRMVTDFNKMGLYGGGLGGQFVVNGRGGLSVGGDLSLKEIALNPLLKAMAGYERLQGAANAQLKFLASGNSLNAIMNSLSGNGNFAIGKGEILGFDLAGMLKNLDASYKGSKNSTIFDGISASFAIDGGTLSNNDMMFDAPLIKAKGEGQVGIGAQTLNYRVTPTDIAGANIQVPVLISGTWANPKFKPDLEGLLNAKLDEEKKKLEAQAKAELEKQKKKLEEQAAAQVKDKLGLPANGTGSVEDQVKKKVEDELVKGLGKLFGNN